MSQKKALRLTDRERFSYYLRTGFIAPEVKAEPADRAALETKFNPYHDPENGRFTFAPGGPQSRRSVVTSWGKYKPKDRNQDPPASGSNTPSENSDQSDIVVTASKEHVEYYRYVQAAKKAGKKRVWPVSGYGRPAKKGEIGPNGKPYSDGRFSLEGKYRTYPGGKPKRHTGVDLPAPVGSPVLAAASGTVLELATASGYGTIVIIDHGDGTRAVYGHLSNRSVRTGDKVQMGDEIGRVGTSGNGTNRGSHLHFEVTESGPFFGQAAKFIDPEAWVNDR